MTEAPSSATVRSAVRLDSLTGARFVAALGVFLYHVNGMLPNEGLLGRALHLLGAEGAIGVDFFFVLSGFVLAWSWRPGGSARSFYRRRFARIAPAYWVTWILGVAWLLYMTHDQQNVVRALPGLLAIQSWFPDTAVYFGGAGVEWSVSVEVFFYAMFPLLVLLVARPRGQKVLVALGVLLGFVVPLVATPFLGAYGDWALNVLPVGRVGEFVCGMLLALAMRRGVRVPMGVWPAVGIFFAVYFALESGPVGIAQRPLLLGPIVLLIGALAQADIDGKRTLIGSRIPVRLGEWSYCFYLVHQIMAEIVLTIMYATKLPAEVARPIFLAGSLVLGTLVAAGLHYLVERPFERRLRSPRIRRVSRSGGSAVPVTADLETAQPSADAPTPDTARSADPLAETSAKLLHPMR